MLRIDNVNVNNVIAELVKNNLCVFLLDQLLYQHSIV